jgi:TfoX/Sxy family transcriptional regulator of competence genes
MTYDEKLADRVRRAIGPQDGVAEKKMFGGICFLFRGNMCFGVLRDDLIVRVGPHQFDRALAEPHARPMDLTGRPMKGMVYVGPGGYESDDDLAGWVRRGVEFAGSLPPK